MWLLACFFLACFFYGPNFNPLLLLPALTGPLAIIALTPAADINALRVRAPLLFWLSAAGLGLVGAHHLIFSLSPDVSFMPSIVLASLPLWTLTVSLLRDRDQFWLFVCVLVAVFGCVSAFEFLFDQQRAHAPLRDPGNYLTLLYMVWLPWVFHALMRELGRGQMAALVLLSYAFALAQLATHSRFAVGVLAGLLLVLAWVLLRQPSARRNGLAVVGAIAAALVSYFALAGASDVAQAFTAGANGAELDQSPRLLLAQAALSAIAEVGGINGAGVDMFSALYPLYRSPLEQSTAGILVHNDLLQLFLEGGIWLSLPLLVVYLAVGLALMKALWFTRTVNLRTGVLLALGFALLHSMLNFVIYALPLVIVFAVLLAIAFAPPAADVQAGSRPKLILPFKFGLLLLLLANTAYLALDVVSMGVLTGYKQVPGTASVRADPERMLSYARLAQTLNERRALPIFFEARLLEQRLQHEKTPQRITRVDLAYQRAAAVNPWNPTLLINHAAFKLEQAQASPEQTLGLLYAGLALNPQSVEANATLLSWHRGFGEKAEALAIAANVAKWCRLMSGKPGAEALFAEVAGAAKHYQAEQLAASMADCQKYLLAVPGGGRRESWLMGLFAGSG